MKKYGIFLAVCVLTLSLFTGCGMRRKPVTAPTEQVMPTVPATLTPTIPYTETVPATTAPAKETEEPNASEDVTNQTTPGGSNKARNRMR